MSNFFDRLSWIEQQRKQEATDNALEKPNDSEYNNCEKRKEQDRNQHTFNYEIRQ